jgi:teichuronic acid biosynthesis glycosyltransferase TuaH
VPEPLVVFCAGRSWDGIAGTHRMIAEELQRHCRVLWVDPPISVATRSSQRYGGSRLPVPRLRHPLPRVTRLITYALPLHTRQGIRATTAPLVRTQIRWALRRLGVEPYAIVDCGFGGFLRGWGPGVRKVLYGTDDYVAGAALMGWDVRALERKERREVADADLVIAVSPALAERWRCMGAREVAMVPNGVRAEAYDGIAGLTPAPGVALRPPVAGVIGHLSERIDVRVLEQLVDEGCSVLLVGPRDQDWEPERVDALIAREGVTWVGRQPHNALAGYLRHVDVGITPYHDTPFNRASFPLKTLEYLAAGLPSVSTDLPAARWLSTDLVRLVNDPAEFPAAVRAEAIGARTPELVEARQAFARRHTWRARAAEIAAHLDITRADADRET